MHCRWLWTLMFCSQFQMVLAKKPSDYQCDLLYVFREAFIILYPWRNQHSLMESGNLKECLPTIYFCLEATLPKNKTANARPRKFTGTQQESLPTIHFCAGHVQLLLIQFGTHRSAALPPPDEPNSCARVPRTTNTVLMITVKRNVWFCWYTYPPWN